MQSLNNAVSASACDPFDWAVPVTISRLHYDSVAFLGVRLLVTSASKHMSDTRPLQGTNSLPREAIPSARLSLSAGWSNQYPH